jgi:hypothetical protein
LNWYLEFNQFCVYQVLAVYSIKVEELLVAEVGFGDWELILELKLLKEGIKIVLVDRSGDTHFSEDKT